MEALDGQILKRNIAKKKNANKWGNKDFQDFYYFDAQDKCYIKRANKYQVKFPLPSKKNFDKYEEAMWSRNIYKIAKDNNHVICERYINAHYDDDFYYCPYGAEERFQGSIGNYFGDDNYSESGGELLQNDDDSIVSQASNIINVSNDNEDTFNPRRPEVNKNEIDEKGHEQDNRTNNTVAGKKIRHEISLSVNSLNKKR